MAQDPLLLDPILLVRSGVSAEALLSALRELGWEPVSPRPADAAPLVLALRWRGAWPLLSCSLNAAGLWVLDLSTASPGQRAGIAARLPLLQPSAIEPLLRHPEPGQRLMGVLAARETSRIDLLQPLLALATREEAPIGPIAADAAAALAREDEARQAALVGARLVADAARPFVEALHDPAGVQLLSTLGPQPGAAARLFRAEVAEAAARAWSDSWRGVRALPRRSPESRLSLHACPAGLLRGPNLLSRAFPGGYREVAGLLRPERTWLCWSLSQQGQRSGISFDGLAWLGDRWVFCPRPWRILRPLLV